ELGLGHGHHPLSALQPLIVPLLGLPVVGLDAPLSRPSPAIAALLVGLPSLGVALPAPLRVLPAGGIAVLLAAARHGRAERRPSSAHPGAGGTAFGPGPRIGHISSVTHPARRTARTGRGAHPARTDRRV